LVKAIYFAVLLDRMFLRRLCIRIASCTLHGLIELFVDDLAPFCLLLVARSSGRASGIRGFGLAGFSFLGGLSIQR